MARLEASSSGRHLFSLASTLVAAALLGSMSVAACGEDTATPADAGGSETVKLLCDTFSGSDTPCSPVSDQICFSMCVTGGCKCVAAPSGGGIWKCTVDESCYPGNPDFDGGPGDDGGTVDTDAGTSDASNEASSSDGGDDGGNDAADAGD